MTFFTLMAVAILALVAVLVGPAGQAGGQEKAVKESVARNVIIFVGDGMGPPTVTAARWYKAQNGLGGLNMDTLPYTAVVRTESANSMVTDSAAAATALFSGHKIDSGALNVHGDEYYTIIERKRARQPI